MPATMASGLTPSADRDAAGDQHVLDVEVADEWERDVERADGGRNLRARAVELDAGVLQQDFGASLPGSRETRMMRAPARVAAARNSPAEGSSRFTTATASFAR